MDPRLTEEHVENVGTAEEIIKIIKDITMAFNVDESLKVYRLCN